MAMSACQNGMISYAIMDMHWRKYIDWSVSSDLFKIDGGHLVSMGSCKNFTIRNMATEGKYHGPTIFQMEWP